MVNYYLLTLLVRGLRNWWTLGSWQRGWALCQGTANDERLLPQWESHRRHNQGWLAPHRCEYSVILVLELSLSLIGWVYPQVILATMTLMVMWLFLIAWKSWLKSKDYRWERVRLDAPVWVECSVPFFPTGGTSWAWSSAGHPSSHSGCCGHWKAKWACRWTAQGIRGTQTRGEYDWIWCAGIRQGSVSDLLRWNIPVHSKSGFLASGKVAPFKELNGGVEFRPSIPKSASGKILRRELKEELISWSVSPFGCTPRLKY